MSSPRFTNPRSPGRTAAVVAGYTLVLAAFIAVALTADFGARKSVARDAVEVAVAPDAVITPIVASALGAGETATLKGVVLFDGNPPNLDPIVKKGDMTAPNPEVCAANDVPNESLVVNKANKGIAHVFVYLLKAPAGAKSSKPGEVEVTFDQKGCQFLPHALVVPVGAKLLIKNGDPVPHNTHTHPLDAENGFNQSVAANDRMGIPFKYSKSQRVPIEVVCDVHRFMKAYHLVLDHPYGAITDADGKFEIADLPAGKHEFKVWHEKVGYLNRTYNVEIKAGEAKEVKLSFGAAKFAGFDGPLPKTIAVNGAP